MNDRNCVLTAQAANEKHIIFQRVQETATYNIHLQFFNCLCETTWLYI